ncbi:MAG: FecR domain-containing protein [Chryseolinea sp.]
MKRGKEIEIDDELIARYLSGEATPEEAVTMMDWLLMPGNRLRFEQLESAWNNAYPMKKPVFKKQAGWNKVDSFIKITSKEKKGNTRFFGLTKVSLGIAASLLIVIASGALLVVKFNGHIKQNTFSTIEESSVMTFADNSIVTLYRHTTLDYPVQFKRNTREVFLEKGEAFFEITPNKKKPFIVHTSGADLIVIGTKFNVLVSGYNTKISVEEGKVMAYTSSDSILLTNGLTGIISPGGAEIKSYVTANTNSWGYATHKLIFKNAPLKSVIRDIEKAYPCKIETKNKDIGSCNLTATFDNDSVEKIVDLIAEILNLTVKRNDGVFILEGEGCP